MHPTRRPRLAKERLIDVNKIQVSSMRERMTAMTKRAKKREGKDGEGEGAKRRP
jgi:hypothetical protein